MLGEGGTGCSPAWSPSPGVSASFIGRVVEGNACKIAVEEGTAMIDTWARNEMKGATVWDPRCRRSLATLCERLADHPGASFSQASGAASRQAAHRIFEHPETTVDGLLA